MVHDVIIVGGSYAGLSAGLPLARARRSVLVLDAGRRRNRFAAAAHGFLAHDGTPPGEIVAEGRAQLMEYPTVDWVAGEVEHARPIEGGFGLRLKHGPVHRARRLILAGGVRDELPALPGLAERWGRSVFHCPYCHGYELQHGPVGVLATSEMSAHQALMLPDWGPTTYLLDGRPLPDAETLAQLQARGVALEPTPVERLAGDEALQVQLKDGRTLALAGLFIATRTDPGPLPGQLGCAMDDGPMGRFVRTDAMKATTVPGVFACGDLARGAGSVPLAVGDGAIAGTAAHRSLMFGL
ncbi:MAG: NAD(P)/FAD-dependent oxidoreductase [Pseudomonadota bacterium]